ncbi:extracellular solute-binding protein, family 1 [Thermoclostridium stercorarium subsp. stercorarium DSM 8532]|uniref:Extracellular solute-binding protein, family 1 n=2 Tax=Thermoclostridium stercorarium TaxID=1510 RepID=L7VPE7_THES1|nr:sugar ABC transporter substrate-binding protein [Thermoclostridium stercorarium]AGC68632.1 extracellular solute-binding protein, family 1 [Thermoclostridium stercorarium subsp. stercorarium DSM 8532]AGI39644.1 ABC transporter permease subunit [Thermoclostridium stercorarium subsp. stercorarium DSM 8532]ANW98973.1 sugar ABC transporter substrate-binding protein [Thermoclostridium stercorarium subsp. thermolacticum DSM 2910]UZQ84614.1 sugar ABC transporter substrate-binding protein [Thermoclos
MKRRVFSAMLSLIFVLTMLAGCGNTSVDKSQSTEPAKTQKNISGEKTTSTAEPVTVTYALWDSNQALGFEKMADEFTEKNPNIKIEIQLNGWSDYWTALDAAASAGTLPDTFWMHSNNFYRYASNEMLKSLDDLIASSDKIDLKNYPEGLVSLYNYNGKQYCIPKDFDTIGLWYNKTMFDEAGLEYPDENWTWDDLYEAAKKLTKPDKSQYGFLAPLHNQEGFYNFIYQNGGTVITPDKKSGYDDPKTIEAMEFYIRFVKEGLSPLIFGDAERAEAMQNGLCAMGFFGSWNLSGFAANEYMAKNFDVTVLPAAPNGGRASIYNGLGYAIAPNTKKLDAAWKWVEYLASEEGQLRQAELGIAISAYKGTADAWVESNKTFNIKCFIDMLDYAVIRPYSNTTAVWEDKVYEELRGAFTGEKTVEQACRDAAAVMNESLAQER